MMFCSVPSYPTGMSAGYNVKLNVSIGCKGADLLCKVKIRRLGGLIGQLEFDYMNSIVVIFCLY